MFTNTISGYTLKLAENALNVSSLRHKIISNNIANVDTPRYKKQNIVFEDDLRAAIYRKENPTPPDPYEIKGYVTNKNHFEFPEKVKMPTPLEIDGRVYTETKTSFRNDKNNIDIDAEMAKLAKNQVLYNALIRKVSDTYKNINYILEEGGRIIR